MTTPPLTPKDRRFLGIIRKKVELMQSLLRGRLVDPRAVRGRRWKLATLVTALWWGMLTNCRSLRAVESLSAKLARGGFGIARRVPDTTLHDLLTQLDPADLRQCLKEQVLEFIRMKALASGWPISVLSIDGKWTGVEEALNAYCQRRTYNDRPPQWFYRRLNATLITAAFTCTVMQMPIPATTNEIGAVMTLIDWLEAAYGHTALFDTLFFDAGFASREHMIEIDRRHLKFIVRIKDNQAALLEEIERVFARGLQRPCHYQAPRERYQGNWHRRELWCFAVEKGDFEWPCRQVWILDHRIEDKAGNELGYERRYYLTNLPAGLLTSEQVVDLMRRHWHIENKVHWVADVIWREDDQPWCRQGEALLVLDLLRIMALNVIHWLRGRRLARWFRASGARSTTNTDAIPWQDLTEWIREGINMLILTAIPETRRIFAAT